MINIDSLNHFWANLWVVKQSWLKLFQRQNTTKTGLLRFLLSYAFLYVILQPINWGCAGESTKVLSRLNIMLDNTYNAVANGLQKWFKEQFKRPLPQALSQVWQLWIESHSNFLLIKLIKNCLRYQISLTKDYTRWETPKLLAY